MFQQNDYRPGIKASLGAKITPELLAAMNMAAEISGAYSLAAWLERVMPPIVAEIVGCPVDALRDGGGFDVRVPKRDANGRLKRWTSDMLIASSEPPRRAAPSVDNAAQVAQVNAALLDAEATIKRLTEAMRAAPFQAPQKPATGRPSRRR